MATSLSAQDVQDALEERISMGIYKPGSRLPPVRSLAVELGTSQSTISRALQGMERAGWINILGRQGVTVSRKRPKSSEFGQDTHRTLKAVAHKWKLSGHTAEDFLAAAKQVTETVFGDQTNFVFTECNVKDLASMADQLGENLDIKVSSRVLIHDLDPKKIQKDNAVVIAPYFHYAEVKEMVGDNVIVLPVHFGPSPETLDQLLEIEAGSHVLVVGFNQRSAERVSAIVRQYVDVFVTQVEMDDVDKLEKLITKADIVVTIQPVLSALKKLPKPDKLIVVKFDLEGAAAAIKMRLSEAG